MRCRWTNFNAGVICVNRTNGVTAIVQIGGGNEITAAIGYIRPVSIRCGWAVCCITAANHAAIADFDHLYQDLISTIDDEAIGAARNGKGVIAGDKVIGTDTTI